MAKKTRHKYGINLSREEAKALFKSNVKRRQLSVMGTPCFEWQGKPDSAGYGRKTFEGKEYPAHRLAFLLFGGVLEDKQVVCHKCDNRLCVRPSHLFAGYPKDNVHDMHRKGRAKPRKGSKHGQAKLTERAVRHMRSLSNKALPHTYFARRYNVSSALACAIRNGRGWQHVPFT